MTLLLSGKIITPASDTLRQLLIKLPDREAVTDVFDYLVGALYSLDRAIELRFVDRPGAWHSTYRPHLPQYVEAVQKGRAVNELWVAGFYFNSAIQRLAACFDRIPKLLQATGKTARLRMASVNSSSYAEWDAVYEELNAFKHDVLGRATGRKIGMNEAAAAFTQAVSLLAASESRLASIYK